MADSVTVEFGAKTSELEAGAERVKEQLEKIRESAERVTEGAKGILEAFGVAFSVEKIIEFVKSMGELGEQTERSAAMLGIAVDKMLELQGIAKLTGTSADGLALGIERMSLNIQHSTRDAFNPSAQALKLLGLNAKELIGLPADQYFVKLSEAVSKFNPSLNLTNAVMQVGGRGIAQLIPLMQKGGEGFNELAHHVAEAQGALAKQIPAMAETNEKINLLSLGTQALGGALFSVFKPAIDGVISGLTNMVTWMRDAVTQGGAMGNIFSLLGSVTKSFATAVSVLVASFQELLEIVNLGMGIIKGDGERAWETWGKGLDDLYGKWKKTFEAIWHDSHLLHVDVHPKATMGAIDVGAHDQMSAQLKQIDTQIEQWRSYYEKLKVFDTGSVASFRMTGGEKIANLKAELEVRAAAVAQLYQKEIAIASGSAVEIAAVREKMNKELEAIDKERYQLEAERLKESTKDWGDAVNAISGAFNSQLRGLLAGTVSWAQAMKSIAGDLIIKIIEEFEKLAIIQPMIKALTSAFSSGPADMLAAAIKMITTQAGPIMAGVTANVAPVAGPAAPAVGAGVAAAAVATAEGLSGAAEGGAWNIPKTSPWLLHAGETVLPAPAAKAFRDMASGGGGGGGSPTINISAWDGASVHAWLRSGGGQLIAKHVANAMNSNPSLRLGY